jgi:hypothetical protein
MNIILISNLLNFQVRTTSASNSHRRRLLLVLLHHHYLLRLIYCLSVCEFANIWVGICLCVCLSVCLLLSVNFAH